MDRLKSSRVAALTLLTTLFAVPVTAGTDSWSAKGQPYGGTVGKILVDPNTPTTLYAVANQQVFKSTDSGVTWAQLFAASSPTLNGDISLDPQAPGTLYAALGYVGNSPGVISGDEGVTQTNPGGIYKTTDGGATWTQIDDGIALYTNWENLGAGTPETDTLCRVAVDPMNEGTVYAGGCTTGMYKSTDGGATWKTIDNGLTPTSAPADAITSIIVNNIVVDPVNPLVLYVDSSEFVNSHSGSAGTTHLYQSTNGGNSWSALAVDASGADADVAIDPADHAHLVFCGATASLASTDSGATWNPIACPAYTLAIAFDPSNSAHLVAVSDYNLAAPLYESTDGGASFTHNTSFPFNDIQSFGSIAFDPATPANVYLGTSSWGLLKSVDGGSTWNPSDDGLSAVHAGQMIEGSDGIIYMATGNAGVFKSSDQGTTWSQVGAGLSGALSYVDVDISLSSLAQDPAAPSTLYTGSDAGLFKSIDGGATWNKSMSGMPPSAGQVDAIGIDPEKPATIYTGIEFSGSGTNPEAAVYKSVDGGATWADASSGLGLTYEMVRWIAVDPQQSNVIFAADDYDGIYKSVDGGANWTLSLDGMGNTQFYVVAIDPTDSNVVYASALQGFYKSTDGGATWTESDAGMTLGAQANGIIQIDPADTDIIYVSPKYGYGQAYVSGDAGADWFALNADVTSAATASMRRMTEAVHPMPHPAASMVATSVSFSGVMIDPRDHKRIYAGGSDGKVYTFDDLHPPKAKTSSSSGGSGSGTGGQAAAGSSGGGGGFSLLSGLMLLMATVRRRFAQRGS
jgi:photosystem II stability/assembly factor-like uncharacterized protein